MQQDPVLSLHSEVVEQWFRKDYQQSKILLEEYCNNLTVHEWHRKSWPLPLQPDLSTDCIWIGSQDATRVIVLISGTHGVEGFCGSAAQSYILNCLQRRILELPEATAILLIHALNPWGMQWARRCDKDGVDINRNFINFSHIPPIPEEYDLILECLVMEDPVKRQAALQRLASIWGQPKFDRVFSGGQYQYSWAPFFGGRQPCSASLVIDEVIQHWRLATRVLVVIDIHSGLGPWAFGELISDHPKGSTGNRFARNIFGNAVAVTANNESFSVTKDGLLDYRWHEIMPDNGCFLTLEFGTGGTAHLFNVLLNEHLFWQRHPKPERDDSTYLQQRLAMLEHFCPNDTLWQQAVLFKTLQVIGRAC